MSLPGVITISCNSLKEHGINMATPPENKKSLETANRVKQQNQKPQPNRKRRPADLPARLAFRQQRQRSKQQKQNTTTKRGQSPNKNTHRIDLPLDAVTYAEPT